MRVLLLARPLLRSESVPPLTLMVVEAIVPASCNTKVPPWILVVPV